MCLFKVIYSLIVELKMIHNYMNMKTWLIIIKWLVVTLFDGSDDVRWAISNRTTAIKAIYMWYIIHVK